MMKFFGMALILFLLAGFSLYAGERQRRITNDTPWLCYYGEDRRVLDVPGVELLILETEAIGDLSPEDKKGRICVGYMSVGEAERNRWFYPDIKDEAWVLEANPDWPDSRLVDVRADAWRELIVQSVAAAIMEAGYDGFILDNVDTAESLLRRDAKLYAGADDATATLIRELRAAYPDAVIIANGGLSIVPGVADAVDAVMYEGTVSTWRENDDGTYSYGEITPQQKTWLRPRLRRVKAAGLPILALEYVDPDDAEENQRVREEVKKAGNSPFVSVRELDAFPGSAELPPMEEER